LFNDASPCPLCGTGACSGYAGDSDPRAVFCGSPVHCGTAPIAAFRPTGVRLWTHTRYGRCGCGERHDRPHTGAGTMQPIAEPAPQLAERRPPAPAEPPPAPSIAILRGQELRTRPAVPFLLPGLVPLGGLVALYGEAGLCKTFIALHLSALLAAGGTWLGQALPRQGQVLYISAEGTGGMPSRYAAWCAHCHGGADVPDLLFILQPVYPTVDEMMQALAAAMQVRDCERPALTVIDTLARCYMGDENGSLAALHAAGLAGATFGALRDATGITRDPALAATLRALQSQGLIARVVDAGSPRGRYYLTGAGERLIAPPDNAAPPPEGGTATTQPTGDQTMEQF
jgi:hypothetical protein